MALTVTYQRVAHALDWLVKVWRDPADNSTVQAVILVDTDGNPTTSGGGGDASAANQVTQTGILTTIDADTGAIAASVAAIDADATTIIGHVDGIETLLTAIDSNTNGVEALLTTIDTSLNNIEAAAGTVAISQVTPGTTNAIAFQKPTTSGLSEAKIDFVATGDNTIVAAVAAQTIRLHRIFFVASAATTIIIKDGATALTGAITVTAGGSFVLDMDGDPWFVCSTNTAFVINQSGTAQISGRAYYRQS